MIYSLGFHIQKKLWFVMESNVGGILLHPFLYYDLNENKIRIDYYRISTTIDLKQFHIEDLLSMTDEELVLYFGRKILDENILETKINSYLEILNDIKI